MIKELKGIHKPFIVLLNCMYPSTQNARELSEELSQKYGGPVLPVNCMELTEEEIRDILAQVLYEFPVREISIDLPKWLSGLEKEHWLRKAVYTSIQDSARQISRIRELSDVLSGISACEYVDSARSVSVNLGTGSAMLCVQMKQELFYRIISEACGLEIGSESGLMSCMVELAKVKKEYDKIQSALMEVEATGYGIVMPGLEELKLE